MIAPFSSLYDFSEPLPSLVEAGIVQLTFPSYKEVSMLSQFVIERLASWNNLLFDYLTLPRMALFSGWLPPLKQEQITKPSH
jgi:hypothetical protein